MEPSRVLILAVTQIPVLNKIAQIYTPTAPHTNVCSYKVVKTK